MSMNSPFPPSPLLDRNCTLWFQISNYRNPESSTVRNHLASSSFCLNFCFSLYNTIMEVVIGKIKKACLECTASLLNWLCVRSNNNDKTIMPLFPGLLLQDTLLGPSFNQSLVTNLCRQTAKLYLNLFLLTYLQVLLGSKFWS